MLSDMIFDHLYRPSRGTCKENVAGFFAGLDNYRKSPFDYDEQHLAILRRLAKKYLANPCFVRFADLQRSAVAFMQYQDGAGRQNNLIIHEDELWLWPKEMKVGPGGEKLEVVR